MNNKLLELIMKEDKLFTVVTFPQIQEIMNEEFEDNSYLINDEDGISKYGYSAYMVNVKWLINNNLLDKCQ